MAYEDAGMEIIAEIGQNHNGDMNLAFELIAEAKRNGANAAKFQPGGIIPACAGSRIHI